LDERQVDLKATLFEAAESPAFPPPAGMFRTGRSLWQE
jgi:hypothetical protein